MFRFWKREDLGAVEHNCQARDISTVALCLVMAVSSSLEARFGKPIW